MTPLPTLSTARLILRPYQQSDGPALQRGAGTPEVAATTGRIPHPYPDGAAEAWIGTHADRARLDEAIYLAIIETEHDALVGGIGFELDSPAEQAELGYWIAHEYWGRGYATEASRAMVEWGFDDLNLHRIHAHYMDHNPESGRVLEKIGMRREGVLRDHIVKHGVRHSAVLYGILRDDA